MFEVVYHKLLSHIKRHEHGCIQNSLHLAFISTILIDPR